MDISNIKVNTFTALHQSLYGVYDFGRFFFLLQIYFYALIKGKTERNRRKKRRYLTLAVRGFPLLVACM